MLEVLGVIYLWLKAGHIIFVIFWMAGLFMLPRFFVYHHECEVGSAEDAGWVERERRLIRIILRPSVLAVWALGLALAVTLHTFDQGWFWAKLLLVAGLTRYHRWMESYAGSLARGERRLDGRKLRMINEVPGIAAALIVVLVVLRPF